MQTRKTVEDAQLAGMSWTGEPLPDVERHPVVGGGALQPKFPVSTFTKDKSE